MRRLTCEDGFEWYRTQNQNRKIYEKLKYYEDLEEQGLLTIINNETFQRDERDRCTHRQCNKCELIK